MVLLQAQTSDQAVAWPEPAAFVSMGGIAGLIVEGEDRADGREGPAGDLRRWYVGGMFSELPDQR